MWVSRRGYADGMRTLLPFQRMQLDDRGLEIVLHADRPLRLTGARGRRIRCLAGCAWLTAVGLRDDVFLHADESWEICTDGLVLIEGADCAAVALDA